MANVCKQLRIHLLLYVYEMSYLWPGVGLQTFLKKNQNSRLRSPELRNIWSMPKLWKEKKNRLFIVVSNVAKKIYGVT